MQSIFWLKVWSVPLVDPVVSKELIAGTRRLAEVATVRILKEMSPVSDFWLSLLDGNVYQYGVETTWLGIVQIADVGYAPNKTVTVLEDEDDDG